jgi:hypothetical protein
MNKVSSLRYIVDEDYFLSSSLLAVSQSRSIQPGLTDSLCQSLVTALSAR